MSHTRIASWEEQVGLFMTVVPSVADILKFLVRYKYWKFLHSLKICLLGPVRYHKIHLLVLDQFGKDWIKISWPLWKNSVISSQGLLDGIYMGDISYGSKDNNNIRRLYHGHNYSYTTIWASADRGHSPHCTGMICYGDTLSAPGPRAATRYFENNRVRD